MTSPFDPPREDPVGPESEPVEAFAYRRLCAALIDVAVLFLFSTVLPLLLQIILVLQGTTLGTRLAGLEPTGTKVRRVARSLVAIAVGFGGTLGALWVALGLTAPERFPGAEWVGLPLCLAMVVNVLPLQATGTTVVDRLFAVRLQRRNRLAVMPTKDWTPPLQHDPFGGALGTPSPGPIQLEDPPEDHILRIDTEEQEPEE